MSPLEKLLAAEGLYAAVRVAPVLGVSIDDVRDLVAGLASPELTSAALTRIRDLGDEGLQILLTDDGSSVCALGVEELGA